MNSVYIVLGAQNSGRREVLLDLVSNGTDANGTVRIYHAGEFQNAGFPNFPREVEIKNWGVKDGTLSIDEPETAPEIIFILSDGRANPVDQMELLAALVKHLNWQVARVLTVVNCALLEKNPALEDWFKACIHFSDVALLSRRENVSNAWMKKFTDAYREACNPCAFELVKKGAVENPARVLLPEARRLSMIFDDTDPLDEMEFDEDNLPDEPFDLVSKPDPYFERNAAGNRCLQIPDITDYST